jgi:hypothetical protein
LGLKAAKSVYWGGPAPTETGDPTALSAPAPETVYICTLSVLSSVTASTPPLGLKIAALGPVPAPVEIGEPETWLRAPPAPTVNIERLLAL